MEQTDIQRAIAAILFAAGECVGAQRMAQAIGCETEQIHEQAQGLMDNWNFERSGVRIVRLEDAYQMCSSAEMAQYVTAGDQGLCGADPRGGQQLFHFGAAEQKAHRGVRQARSSWPPHFIPDDGKLSQDLWSGELGGSAGDRYHLL